MIAGAPSCRFSLMSWVMFLPIIAPSFWNKAHLLSWLFLTIVHAFGTCGHFWPFESAAFWCWSFWSSQTSDAIRAGPFWNGRFFTSPRRFFRAMVFGCDRFLTAVFAWVFVLVICPITHFSKTAFCLQIFDTRRWRNAFWARAFYQSAWMNRKRSFSPTRRCFFANKLHCLFITWTRAGDDQSFWQGKYRLDVIGHLGMCGQIFVRNRRDVFGGQFFQRFLHPWEVFTSCIFGQRSHVFLPVQFLNMAGIFDLCTNFWPPFLSPDACFYTAVFPVDQQRSVFLISLSEQCEYFCLRSLFLQQGNF